MKKLASFIVLALLLVLCAVPVYAQPSLPHAFYGTVKINSAPAPNGTRVSATVAEGDALTTSQNPIATVNGNYGIDGLHLLVQGDGLSGAITFYVNGVKVEGVTATFEAGGGPTEKNLTVTIPTGGGIAVTPTIKAKLFGVSFTFSIDKYGKILETIKFTSKDGKFTLTIPKGTIALDKYGNPLETLEADVDESPPDPPEGAHIIGLAYDLGPDGATFDPPITVEFTYDPDDLPEDLEEEDLVIAYYDEDADEWVELDCEVDTVHHTVTAEVDHFTIFTIIAPAPAPPVVPPPVLAPAAFTSSSLSISPLEVNVGKTVTISVLLSNTGEEEGSYTVTLKVNGVVEKTKEITLAGGASETVTFTTSKDKAGIYSVDVNGLIGSFTVKEVAPPPPAPPPAPPEVKPEVNWPVVAGVIAAVVVVGLLIFFMVRRRAY